MVRERLLKMLPFAIKSVKIISGNRIVGVRKNTESIQVFRNVKTGA